jgi:hypothetical protein
VLQNHTFTKETRDRKSAGKASLSFTKIKGYRCQQIPTNWAGSVAQVVEHRLASARPMVQTPAKKIKIKITGCWWLTPIILAAQETESRAKSVMRPYLEKTHDKKGLVEWLKV